MSAREPDAISPWAVVTFEHVEGATTLATGYRPMPRSAAAALLEVLDYPEPWDAPLQPARATVDEVGVLTRVAVVFGREAIGLLLAIDNLHGGDARPPGEVTRWVPVRLRSSLRTEYSDIWVVRWATRRDHSVLWTLHRASYGDLDTQHGRAS